MSIGQQEHLSLLLDQAAMDIVQVLSWGPCSMKCAPVFCGRSWTKEPACLLVRCRSRQGSRAWHPVQVIAFPEALPPVQSDACQQGKCNCPKEGTILAQRRPLPDQGVQLRTQLRLAPKPLTWHSRPALHAVYSQKGWLPAHCNRAQCSLDSGSLLKPKAHG